MCEGPGRLSAGNVHKDNKNLKFGLFLDIASLYNLGKVADLKLTINLECYLFNFQIRKW